MALSRKPVAVGKTKKLDGRERTLLRTPKQLYNGSFSNGSEEVLRFPVPLTHCGPKITKSRRPDHPRWSSRSLGTLSLHLILSTYTYL